MNILITGASGLIGNRLTDLLLQKGYKVAHMGRKKTRDARVRRFTWDPAKRTVDAEAFEWAEAIVNLSGANVGEKRWTAERKKEIVESRTSSLRLIASSVKQAVKKPTVLISASGTGYYGTVTSDNVFTEKDAAAKDFFGGCCKQWEEAADLVTELDVRCVKLRIGAVLAREGGALKKLAAPVKWGVGAPIGNGKQWMPWIHIDDLCAVFIHAIENKAMEGAYNTASSQHCTNRQFMKALGKALHRPVFFPGVPKFLLTLFLGEMATVVTEGSRVSNEKLLKTDFEFRFDGIDEAMKDLLG